jgi:hypothetical protein
MSDLLLMLAAQEAAGHPPDTVRRLRLEHGAIAAAAIIATLQAILDRHDAWRRARTGCTPPATGVGPTAARSLAE